MSTPVQNITLIAGEDLSNSRFKAVKVDTDGTAVKAGAGQNAVGIIQNAPGEGEAVCVMALGISDVIYGGNVTAGQNLACDAQGRLVVAGGSDAVVAVALKNGALNEQHRALLITRTASGTTGMSQATACLSIPITLADMDDTDIVTDFIPGFVGEIAKISFITGDPAVTAAKTASISASIEGTAVTGGALALTSANCGARGAVVDASAITGNNSFDATEKITITAGNVVAAFGEGTGTLVLMLKQTA